MFHCFEGPCLIPSEAKTATGLKPIITAEFGTYTKDAESIGTLSSFGVPEAGGPAGRSQRRDDIVTGLFDSGGARVAQRAELPSRDVPLLSYF